MRLLPLPGVFKPPSDARLLAGHLAAEPRVRGGSVLDLCTGSGYLAIAAALAGAREVAAVDVSWRAVLAARMNARLNGVRVRSRHGDLLEPFAARRFDVIVSNPPYLPNPEDLVPSRGIERASEAGSSGRVFLDRICSRAFSHLTEGGVLFLVHSSVCGERRTLELLARAGLDGRVVDRRLGPLGPLLRARVDWLRSNGLLVDGDQEEILVFRAERLAMRHPVSDAANGTRAARIAAG